MAVLMRRLVAFALLVIGMMAAGAAHPQPLRAVALGDLCVTNGEIRMGPNGRLEIDSPSSRAVLRFRSDPAAEIRFTYLGPSEQSKPLASGELRRQIGVKLRAEDTCNLVYAMWHIEPDSRIAVSIKRNAGMSTHEQCDAGGYINLKPSGETAPPRIIVGQAHVLRAEMRGASLIVSADGVEAWHGDLGPVIAAFDGPVGLRTDNARFAFDYHAGRAKPGPATLGCKKTPGD
jgi:hypothetical protein